MMETAFYDDYNSTHNSFRSTGMNTINQLKRKLTLDLNIGASGDGGNGKQTSVIKKAKVASLNTPICAVLNTPDINMCKLASPELERLIIQQTSQIPTPTPTQSQLFFPKNVTEEQELYARGFTDALFKLKSQNESVITTLSSNNNNPTITTSVSSILNPPLANNDLTSHQLTSTSNASTHQLISNDQTMMQISGNLSHGQIVTTTTAQNDLLTSTSNARSHQLLGNSQHLMQSNLNQVVHPQHPPPPYYDLDQDSSDMTDDSMSENSCSNSTTSSSTYTTNGHVLVPPSSVLMLNNNNAQGHHGFPVTSASSMIHHHRLPDYHSTQLGSGGGSASGTASIPVSAASYPHASHSPHLNVIKEEPHTISSAQSSPPVSPIDMASQEKIKLERKRQRNRVAASKCRKRKLERISKLEDKVKQLKNENSDLTNVMTKLKETVCNLKQQVLEHVNSGCQIIVNQSMNNL